MKRDITFNRARFDKARNYYGNKGIAPQTAQLRVEVPTVKGKGSYDFDIRKEIARASEKMLKRNDLFVVRAIGFGLMVEDPAMPGHAPVYSYPVIKGAAALAGGLKGLTNGHGFAIYNGAISMKTGQQVNYSKFPMSEFLTIPRTQASDTQLPQFNEEQILVELPEEIALAGTRDHRITLEFPANANTDVAGEAGTQAYLVLIFEGWLLEGGTNRDFKENGNPYSNAI